MGKYLTTGIEEGGINLVVVLADGYDREEVGKKQMVELSNPYTKLRFLLWGCGSGMIDSKSMWAV